MRFISKVLGTIVTIAMAAGGYFLFVKGQEEAASAVAPKSGACVSISGGSFDADHQEVTCDSAQATYKVVSEGGQCDPAETNYTITLGDDQGNVADLCLAWNAVKGDCFRVGNAATPDEKVDCASATPGDSTVTKVLDVHDSATGKCPKGATPLRNETRDTVICMGAAA